MLIVLEWNFCLVIFMLMDVKVDISDFGEVCFSWFMYLLFSFVVGNWNFRWVVIDFMAEILDLFYVFFF